jgi:hypothetical protein
MIVLTLIQDFPKPTVEWHAYTGRGWTVQQDGVQYKYILTSSIEVKEKSDFKLYMLRIVNKLAYLQFNYLYYIDRRVSH